MQILCEYTVYVAVTLITLLALALVFGIVLYNVSIGITEFEAMGIFSLIGFIFKILPVILAICAMQVFMYEIVSGTVSSLILQFLCAIILGYLSGCFYPNYFFPDSLRNVVDILPTGAGFAYMRRALIYESDISNAVLLLVYAVIFIALSCVIRKKKMAGDMR